MKPWMRMGTSCVCLAACTGTGDERPYDAVLVCQSEDDPLLDRLDDAIALLDRDGDGALTDRDARPGEGLAITALEGTHTLEGQASEPGFAVHSDMYSGMFLSPYSRLAYWVVGVNTACLPSANLSISVESEYGVEEIQVGSYPATLAGLLMYTHDVASMEEYPTSNVEGTIHITEVEDGTISGYFEGHAVMEIGTLIPDIHPTGQIMHIHGLAFRQVPLGVAAY